MKYLDLEKYYLCGIGQKGKVEMYRVGRYDKERMSFLFSNGSYSPTELYDEPRGGNATYVITEVCLQMLDDKGLLE